MGTGARVDAGAGEQDEEGGLRICDRSVPVELAARTTTEGAAWNIVATFPLKPIRLP